MFDVDIIATGSSGNMAVIDGVIMVDCGIRKEQVPTGAKDGVNALLVTHRHTDHLMPSTLAWLAEERPELMRQVWMPADCFDFLANHRTKKARAIAEKAIVAAPGLPFRVHTRKGGYVVEPFACAHDVENLGYLIESPSGETLVWATDTMHMEDAPRGPFDCICLEGNYDEAGLEEALADPERTDRAARNLRHLSVDDYEAFVRSHLAPGGKTAMLHRSSEFGRDPVLPADCLM